MWFQKKILEILLNILLSIQQFLPIEKGFKTIHFDKLPNYFGNNKVEYRGYELSVNATSINKKLETLEELKTETFQTNANENEFIIYRANPINQFNEFTAIAHEFVENLQSGIFVSPILFEKLELKIGDKVSVKTNDNEISLNIYCDNQIAGDIAYVSTFEKSLKYAKLIYTIQIQ